MENASKALIIAGAILLAILIIGLGVFIYNQASNTVGETGMDQVAIRQFNGQFEPYINKTIDSTAAKALIDTVNLSNRTGTNKIDLPVIASKSEIKTGHKYTTDVEYSNGVVSRISISDANSSSNTGGDVIAEETPEEFNAHFTEYLGSGKTVDDIDALDVAIRKYGEGRISVDISEVNYGRMCWYTISVQSYDSEGRIETIYIRLTECK